MRRKAQCIANQVAGRRDRLSHPSCPCPGRSIIIPRIVALGRRGIDPEFCPPLPYGRGRIGDIDKGLSLWMSLLPHPTNQIGQLVDACHSILDGADWLIGTDKRVPHFDDEDGCAVLICLPRDLK